MCDLNFVQSLIGGLMLSCAVFFLMLYNGRILGISGILGGIVDHLLLVRPRNGTDNDHHLEDQDVSDNNPMNRKGRRRGSTQAPVRKKESHPITQEALGQEKQWLGQPSTSIWSNTDFQWRASFLAGASGASFLLRHHPWLSDTAYGRPDHQHVLLPGATSSYILAGVLVGVGTRLGYGCTSGHMLCGLSRSSPRSVIATLVFFFTASMTSVFTGRVQDIIIIMPSPDVHVADIVFDLSLLACFTVLFLVLPTILSRQRHLILLSSAGLSGFVFVFGLALGGMLQPRVIIQFLDGVGRWALTPLLGHVPSIEFFDLSLAGVVLGGVLPNMVFLYPQIIAPRPRPLFDVVFCVPRATLPLVEWRLIAGPVLFGLGWGWAGICPGPALGILITGEVHGLVFVASVLASMYLFGWSSRRIMAISS